MIVMTFIKLGNDLFNMNAVQKIVSSEFAKNNKKI